MKRLGWAILIILPVWLAPQPAESASLAFTPEQQDAMRMAYDAGYHYGFPVLFQALVWVESKDCRVTGPSRKGAVGCAQILPHTADGIAGAHIPVWILTDPSQTAINMALGAKYLDLCLRKFGFPAGVGCYERGLYTHMSARRLGRTPYTRAVLAKFHELLEKYDD